MELKTGLRNRLVNDSVYLALLGNPTEEPYKTFFIDPAQTPDFPFVVFYFFPSIVDGEISREIIAKRKTAVFNVWSQDGAYEEIANRIIYLLHQYGNSEGFRVVYNQELNELYDKQMNAYGLNLKFSIFCREKIV